MTRIFFVAAWLGIIGLVIASTFSALAASNTVPSSVLAEMNQAITANDLKPADCADLDLENIIVGGNGGPGNDLILGGINTDTLAGGDGDDCILGGGDDDTLLGGNGNDVLLGSSGDDSLSGDDGSNDACYGGDGTDLLDASCETQVQ